MSHVVCDKLKLDRRTDTTLTRIYYARFSFSLPPFLSFSLSLSVSSSCSLSRSHSLLLIFSLSCSLTHTLSPVTRTYHALVSFSKKSRDFFSWNFFEKGAFSLSRSVSHTHSLLSDEDIPRAGIFFEKISRLYFLEFFWKKGGAFSLFRSLSHTHTLSFQ